MPSSLFILATLLPLALSQTTTIKLPFIGWDDTPIVASVISAAPSATVLALACPPGTDASDCGMFPAQILTYGPSMWLMDMSEPGDEDFTATQDCSIGASTAVCKESASGSEANFPGSSTETYTDLTSLAVTITAGAEKLGASAGPTTSGSASQAASTGSSKATSGAAASTGASASTTMATQTHSSASSSTSGTAAPAQHTGAAARGFAVSGGLVGAAFGMLRFLM